MIFKPVVCAAVAAAALSACSARVDSPTAEQSWNDPSNVITAAVDDVNAFWAAMDVSARIDHTTTSDADDVPDGCHGVPFARVCGDTLVWSETGMKRVSVEGGRFGILVAVSDAVGERIAASREDVHAESFGMCASGVYLGTVERYGSRDFQPSDEGLSLPIDAALQISRPGTATQDRNAIREGMSAKDGLRTCRNSNAR